MCRRWRRRYGASRTWTPTCRSRKLRSNRRRSITNDHRPTRDHTDTVTVSRSTALVVRRYNWHSAGTVVFRVFFCVLLTAVFFQWHFIDLFSCVAASLFNKLTYLLTLITQFYRSDAQPTVLKHWRPGARFTKYFYDSLTIMPKLRSTYDRRIIHKTSYEEREAFLRYSSLAKS